MASLNTVLTKNCMLQLTALAKCLMSRASRDTCLLRGSCYIAPLHKAFLVATTKCCLSRRVLLVGGADGSLIVRSHATEARQVKFYAHNNNF